jgi:NADH:ubiquinone oxidoreductase subunit E
LSETESIDRIELDIVNSIIENHKKNKGNSITLLQDIQEKFGYLPYVILSYTSKKLKIPLADLYGVATFYAQFSFNKKGKYVITCCDGTACHVKGAPLLIEFCENYLGIKPGETTKDGLFTLETVACFGCCAISPVITINDDFYGNLTPKKTKQILDKLKKTINSTEADSVQEESK